VTAQYDVAIVGYGPTGVVLANLLGAAGLRVAVFERDANIHDLPRAVAFDGEVMRVFQALGLASALGPVVRPSPGMRYVSAQGQTLVVREPARGEGPQGWANHYLFHQPSLERVLRDGVARYPGVEVCLRHEVRAVADGAERATLDVEDLDHGVVRPVEASWIVGCEGARSLVRRAIGADHEDLGLHQPWLVVDFVLEREVDLPPTTVQYCEPERPTTYVNVMPDRRRWEIMLMPGDDPDTIAQPASMWALVSRWLKPGDARLERSAVYTFHSLLARRWRAGRLLIAGDAAHQTPPFLGQGMCAGIRDAANLAWKLGLVARGAAADRLLDTYESERLPHVREFIDLAVRMGNIIQTTDPRVAAERDARFAAGGAPELLVYPTPPLGPGARDDGADPTGVVFPQPRLDDGRRLDDAVGYRFASIGHARVIDGVSSGTRRRWEELGVSIVAPPGAAQYGWLAEHEAAAVMVRPDRYVLGLARTSGDLDRLTTLVPA
jgi:3-(3-hydroxy-phenyl)propionate hydroxylase